MNTFFKITALAGLLAIAGHAFAVDDITRADQILVLKEETAARDGKRARDVALYPLSLPSV